MNAIPVEYLARRGALSTAVSFSWRFVMALVLLLGAVYLDDNIWDHFLIRRLTEVSARAVALNMQLIGLDAVLEANTVTFSGHSFAVVAECVGLEVYALFISAILATPVALVDKWKGIAIGVPVLVLVNHARMVTIVALGAISTRWIDVGHLYIWPLALIVLAIGLWLSWMRAIEDEPRILD